MGILDGDKVMEKFNDSIQFNGERYVVELRRKVGRYVICVTKQQGILQEKAEITIRSLEEESRTT